MYTFRLCFVVYNRVVIVLCVTYGTYVKIDLVDATLLDKQRRIVETMLFIPRLNEPRS